MLKYLELSRFLKNTYHSEIPLPVYLFSINFEANIYYGFLFVPLSYITFKTTSDFACHYFSYTFDRLALFELDTYDCVKVYGTHYTVLLIF